MELPEKVRDKLRALPDKPGCYMMRDRRGRIVYVGKAASLRKRVQSYFREATLRRGSPKLRGLVKSIHDLDCVVMRSEAEAILLEGRLIKDYKPRYNVSFRDDKRFLLLSADPAASFPRFRLCRLKRQEAALYFGPYASSASARATLEFVEKHYGIRKCAPREPDAETYRHCLNDIIRFCLAPCVGKVTPQAYRARFEEACAFLRGEKPAVLAELRAKMREASDKLDFEKAMALRDTLFHLQATVRQRARVKSAPEMKERDALAGVAELQQVLGLPVSPRLIEAFDISNISGTYAVAGMVCAEDGLPCRKRYRRFRIKTVEGSDDPAMIAEAVARHVERLRKEQGRVPDLLLVDGGITQWRAARAVLAMHGMPELPVAGLAKQFEEIYWKDGKAPLRLPRDSQALRVLQNLRDEAHRFALTYHRHLRSRRIQDSALDDIPGIGPTRKQQLLQHFGSVRRLACADVAAIAAAPGIGPRTAKLIKECLSGASDPPGPVGLAPDTRNPLANPPAAP